MAMTRGLWGLLGHLPDVLLLLLPLGEKKHGNQGLPHLSSETANMPLKHPSLCCHCAMVSQGSCEGEEEVRAR